MNFACGCVVVVFVLLLESRACAVGHANNRTRRASLRARASLHDPTTFKNKKYVCIVVHREPTWV